MATLESTAFLALGFGTVNGQDFRTRRDPLGRFTLFLISQLVSGSRVSLTQGRRTSWSGNCRERARVLQSRCRKRIIHRTKQVCRTTVPTCFWMLVVSSPTCLWWKRGPVGHFFWQVPQRSGQGSIGKLTCQNLRQYGEHHSPAQWPHMFPRKTKLVLLYPNPQLRTKQHPTDLHKANLFTFTQANKRQATDQPKRMVEREVNIYGHTCS